MATDNESIPTTQFPEEVPQTIPELYLRLKARMDAGFGDRWKEILEIKREMREMEMRINEESRLRYVDLRQRIERLQSGMNLLDERFELYNSEINYLRKSLRELERKVEPPLAA